MTDFDMHSFALQQANSIKDKIDYETVKSALKEADYGKLHDEASRLVQSLASNWSKKSLHKIVEHAPDLGMAVAEYLGLSGAGLLPAAATAVISQAARIGLNYFNSDDTTSGKQLLHLKIGDYVAIRKNFLSKEQVKEYIATEALKGHNELPEKQVNVGIVQEALENHSLFEVVNLSTGTVENVRSHDLMPYTLSEMKVINADPTFNKVRRLIMDTDPLAQVEIAHKPTSGNVAYNGEDYQIEGKTRRGEGVIISNPKGHAVVPYNKLEHVWSQTNYHQIPDQENSFSQATLPFAGEYIYYYLNAKANLGVIQCFKADLIYLCDCLTGKFRETAFSLIYRVDQNIFSGTYFKKYAQNVIDGNTSYVEANRIGLRFPELIEGTSLDKDLQRKMAVFFAHIEETQQGEIVIKRKANVSKYHDHLEEAVQLGKWGEVNLPPPPVFSDNAILYIGVGAALFLVLCATR